MNVLYSTGLFSLSIEVIILKISVLVDLEASMVTVETLTGQLLCQKYDRGGSNHNVHISSWGHVFCLRYLLSHKDKK